MVFLVKVIFGLLSMFCFFIFKTLHLVCIHFAFLYRVNDVLYIYYAAFDRVDMISGDSADWQNLVKTNFVINQMAGDSILPSTPLFLSSNTSIYSVFKNGTFQVFLENVTPGPFAVSNGIFYFTNSSSVPMQIYSCQVSNCLPTPYDTNINGHIRSIAVDDNGSVYYSTEEGIFPTGQSISAVSYQENIMPFALAFNDPNLYILDITTGL